MTYQHDFPVELTADQHIDIIRALTEHNNTRFKMIRNIFPAYKKKDGHWVKFDAYQEANAFQAEKDFDMTIESLPASLDRLGGIAKVKDQRRLYAVLNDFCDNIDWDSLTPEQAGRKLKATLEEAGAIMPLNNIDNTIHHAIKKRSSPYWLQRALNDDNQVVVWQEHHPRLSEKRTIDKSQLKTYNGEQILVAPGLIESALKQAAREHYMRPDMFVNAMQTHFHNKNLAIKLPNEPGQVDKISDMTRDSLLEVLEIYREKGADFLVEVAHTRFQLAYRPLNQDTRSITPEMGISMLRQALEQPSKKKSTEDPIETSGQDIAKEKIGLLEVISTNDKIDQWRGAIELVAGKQEPKKKEKMLVKLSEILGEPSSFSAVSLNKKREVLGRLPKVYGRLISSESSNLKNHLIEKMQMWLTERPEEYRARLINTFEQDIDRIISAAGDPPSAYLALRKVASFMSPEQLMQQEKIFQKEGTLGPLMASTEKSRFLDQEISKKPVKPETQFFKRR